jgi:hypothetical protein
MHQVVAMKELTDGHLRQARWLHRPLGLVSGGVKVPGISRFESAVNWLV